MHWIFSNFLFAFFTQRSTELDPSITPCIFTRSKDAIWVGWIGITRLLLLSKISYSSFINEKDLYLKNFTMIIHNPIKICGRYSVCGTGERDVMKRLPVSQFTPLEWRRCYLLLVYVTVRIGDLTINVTHAASATMHAPARPILTLKLWKPSCVRQWCDGCRR